VIELKAQRGIQGPTPRKPELRFESHELINPCAAMSFGFVLVNLPRREMQVLVTIHFGYF